MAEELIEVTIRADGTVEMRVDGVAGMQCLDATDPLVQALGGEVVSQEMTAEAYQDDEQGDEERLRW